MKNYAAYLLIIVFLLAGGAAGYYVGVDAGWDMAREELHDELRVDNTTLERLGGRVTSIIDGNLVVRSEVPPVDLLSEKDLSKRTVEVDQNTEIVRIKQKPEEQFQREMEQYRQSQGQNNTQALPSSPVPREELPPSPVTEEEISFEDIEVGDRVSVRSQEDMTGKKKFVAARIEVIEISRNQSFPG